MSYPYAQDSHRDKKDKGEQPFEDARQAMSENEAELRNRGDDLWENDQREGVEARTERLRAEAEERLKEVQDELSKS